MKKKKKTCKGTRVLPPEKTNEWSLGITGKKLTNPSQAIDDLITVGTLEAENHMLDFMQLNNL